MFTVCFFHPQSQNCKAIEWLLLQERLKTRPTGKASKREASFEVRRSPLQRRSSRWTTESSFLRPTLSQVFPVSPARDPECFHLFLFRGFFRATTFGCRVDWNDRTTWKRRSVWPPVSGNRRSPSPRGEAGSVSERYGGWRVPAVWWQTLSLILPVVELSFEPSVRPPLETLSKQKKISQCNTLEFNIRN